MKDEPEEVRRAVEAVVALTGRPLEDVLWVLNYHRRWIEKQGLLTPTSAHQWFELLRLYERPTVAPVIDLQAEQCVQKWLASRNTDTTDVNSHNGCKPDARVRLAPEQRAKRGRR